MAINMESIMKWHEKSGGKVRLSTTMKLMGSSTSMHTHTSIVLDTNSRVLPEVGKNIRWIN